MSSSPDHESSMFIRLDGKSETAPLPAIPELSICDLNSQDPLPSELRRQSKSQTPPVHPNTAKSAGTSSRPSVSASSETIWRNGDVLMCACPDCQAPMSIRVWLMVADCWQCSLSIELTEEQERAARRLMAAAEEEKRSANSARPNSEATSPATATSDRSRPRPDGPKPKRPVSAEQESPDRPAQLTKAAAHPTAAAPQQRNPPQPGQQPTASQPRPRRPAAATRRTRARLQKAKRRGVSAWLSDAIGMTPAWLISLIFHLIVLTLMALLLIGDEQADPYITLSTTVSKDVHIGGDTQMVDPMNELAFDLPLPRDIDVDDQVQLEAIIKANQEAKALRVDPATTSPNLPDLNQVKQLVGGKTGISSALAARDPRIRVEMVRQEGGTTLTEAAVARGLRWLSKHQNADGSWSLDRFNRSSGCTCSAPGIHSNSAGTSLALLPFLGAGQTHLVGHYRESVARGLRWLIAHQKQNGDLRADSAGNSGMYAQGQCAIVLCETFFMTGDEELRVPAQRAIDFIVDAQHGAGGWRYQPRQKGDTSVFGWQLMALQSARAANLTVPAETLTLASQYLDSVQSSDGALYAYQGSRGPDHVMTAEALLCRMYLGWTTSDPGLQRGMDYLANDHLPEDVAANIYYWYYATQALHHVGGSKWERWNRQMRSILVKKQKKRGHEAGSWDPQHSHDRGGGRLYATALATCTLEVYYRHLPIFRQIELE